MYLTDSNVFLEIILGQAKEAKCKRFLEENTGALFISDFSLHSIGVILFRNGMEDKFQTFAEETVRNIEMVSLPQSGYVDLRAIRAEWGLDFDDAYQFAVAREFGQTIATIDRDFKKVASEVDVLFL